MTRWAVAAGAAAGFAALIRIDSVLLYPGLALVLLGPVRRVITVFRPRVHPFIAFCVPAAFCGVLLLGLNWAHFGGPFATGYGDQPEGVRFSTPLLAGLYGFLFSAGKGIFFFSPPLILGLWPFESVLNSEFMANEVPGVRVPDAVLERMRRVNSPEAARAEGVAIARELGFALKSLVQGAQVAAPSGHIESAVKVLAGLT